jgi:hypothetical protein
MVEPPKDEGMVMHQQTKRALDRIIKSEFSVRVLLPDEDPNEFHELCDQLLLEFSPCGPAQEECLRSIAAPLWRKLHPRMQQEKLVSKENRRISLSEAMEIYRAQESGISAKERQAENNNDLRQEDAGADVGPPTLHPGALRERRRIDAELDAKVVQAIKQMITLKQIKGTAY